MVYQWTLSFTGNVIRWDKSPNFNHILCSLSRKLKRMDKFYFILSIVILLEWYKYLIKISRIHFIRSEISHIIIINKYVCVVV